MRSNVDPDRLDAAEAVHTYRNVSRIDSAFRSLRIIGLKARPISHWRGDCVPAHVLLRMLAYYVAWQVSKALAPILFNDNDPEAAVAQ